MSGKRQLTASASTAHRDVGSGRPRVRRRSLARLALLGLAAALSGDLLATSALPAAADPTPGATTTSCPSYNPPNALGLSSGTPQSAKLDTPFSDPLQVTLTNTDGCPITTPMAGIAVTFAAPGAGPSGSFSSSGSNAVLVGTDASGSATAPQFTANTLPGGYIVTASSDYGAVSFSLVNTAAGVAATITAQPPLSQAAVTDAVYGAPLQVLVLDANGTPVDGATVTFSLGSGGGGTAGGATGSSAAGATFATGQAQATATTNASGIATSPMFSANDTPGSYMATAATAGVSDPAAFRLDNVAGRPPRLGLVEGAHLSAPVDARYGTPLEVKVLSAAGKPVEGATVTFALGSSSGGSSAAGAAAPAGSPGASFLGGSSQATETTGPKGTATSPLFTANGTPGTFTATVSVTGRTNPLLVTLDNLAAKPPVIRPLDGARQSASVDARYHRPLMVKVLSSAGKPVQGTTVTFALGAAGSAGAGGGGAGAAGASFLDGTAQATETTNADGVAVSPLFTANGTSGMFTAAASVSGVTNPALFSLDNLAAKPPAIRPSGADPRSATVGGRYRSPLRVTVVAADGKPVQGATVTFTLGAAGGGAGTSGSPGASFVGGSAQSTETTNAVGQAVSPAFTANTVAGGFTATAAVTDAPAVATFGLRNLAGTPVAITAGAAASEQTTIGTRFPIRLAVTVKDKDGNPVPGTIVTFAAPASGATGSFAGNHHSHSRRVRVKTDSDGIALAPAFGANGTAGGYVVTATVKGAGAAAFALVNQPPPAP